MSYSCFDKPEIKPLFLNGKSKPLPVKSGFIYVATNPLFEQFCKIGITSKYPEKRMASLSTTALPFDYELQAYVWADHCGYIERETHRKLDKTRVNAGREFFQCDCDLAYKTIMDIWHSLYGDDLDACWESHSHWRVLDINEDIAKGIQRGVA